MQSLPQCFREWYAHECDCNRKILEMLDSVPHDRRTDPQFQKGVDLMAHMVFWRLRWLGGIGFPSPLPEGWKPEGTPLADLPGLVSRTEEAWTKYLTTIDNEALERDITWSGSDGKLRRWRTGNVLHQVAGHHWYHRGQITLLVTMLGGKPTSTDYIFFNPPRVDG